MSRRWIGLVLLGLWGCGDGVGSDVGEQTALPPGAVRFATFNASLNRPEPGELRHELAQGSDQARATAAIIQRVRPDVLLLQEIDYDPEALELFHDAYLAVGQEGERPIEYGYRWAVPSNTGVASGYDLDNDGAVGGPGDAYGFGDFEGQFAFAVLSRFPIDRDAIRTFRELRYSKMPGVVFPKKQNGSAWYNTSERAKLRLSSKNHADVPIDVAGTRIHLLAHHPTPPAFDGPEDRNGLRNFDEIRFWADYLTPGQAEWIRDDAGEIGGLPEGEPFVIAGDHNADPFDGSGRPGAIAQLLEHPAVDASLTPSSEGAVEAAEAQGGKNAEHAGDPAFDTGDFGDSYLGNLRLDYVLPSKGFELLDARVFWPTADDPAAGWIAHSDHRLVWLDLQVY